MASGNYLVIGSKFKPFSYEEMLHPVQMATAAQQDVESQYSDLATKANVWEGMADEQADPYAYKMYKNYANDLETQAETLAREGLTPSSRRSMLQMKERYSSDIIPIEQAYTRRRELIDEQRKLQAQDPTLMFERAATTLSLDDLITNPNISPASYSGKLITQQVAGAAQALSKEMRDNPRKWRNILGNQYFETLMQKGYRPEEVLLAASEDPNAPQELKNIVEDAVKSSGISSWGDDNNLQRAYDYARQGLWNAVGETQYQVQSNKAYDFAMREALSKKAKDEEPPKDRLFYRAVPRTSVDPKTKTTELGNDKRFLEELLENPDSLFKTTKRYRPGQSSPSFGAMVTQGGYEDYNPNIEKLKKIGEKYGVNINLDTQDGNITEENLSDVITQLERGIASSAVREFSYKPNITQSDLITQVIQENMDNFLTFTGETGLKEYKKGKVGDTISPKKVEDYFSSDSHITFDVDDGFILHSTKDGKKYSAVIDTELIDDPNRTFKGAQQAISTLLQEGEPEAATEFINEIMESLYYRFNTLEKRESNTFSKEDW